MPMYRFHLIQIVKQIRIVDVPAETDDEALEYLDSIPYDEGIVVEEEELDYDIGYVEVIDDD